MRRTLVTSALVALAVAPHAVAAPVTGVDDGAGADFVLTTAAGRSYEVRVLATRPTQAGTTTAPRLRVHVMESGTKRSGELPSAAFTISGGRATLTARLAGAPLRVVWQVDEATVAVSYGEAGSDLEGSDGWMVAGQGGSAQVTWGAVRCTTDAAVIGSVVAHETDGYGGPLTQDLGVALKGARCSSPASSELPPIPARAGTSR